MVCLCASPDMLFLGANDTKISSMLFWTSLLKFSKGGINICFFLALSIIKAIYFGT